MPWVAWSKEDGMGAIQEDRSRVSLRGRKHSSIYRVDEDGYLRDDFGWFVTTPRPDGLGALYVTIRNKGQV